MSKNPYTYQHNFDISNITTDPFALGTLSVGIISWLIFLGGCAASTKTDFNFPRFSWWSLAYEIALILVLFIFYCFDLIDSYRNFLTAGFAVAFIYSTNSANNLVYSSGSALAAASTGVILISMLNMIWLFYYGADSDSPINRWIDGFSLSKGKLVNNKVPRSRNENLKSYISNGNGYDTLISHPINSNRGSMNDNPFNSQKNYTDYDDETHANTQMNSLSRANSHYSQKFSAANSNTANSFTNNNNMSQEASYGQNGFGMPSASDANSFNTNQYSNSENGGAFDQDQDIYPYRAKALYAYEASADDVNEISFEKGEILMISDIQGRWWQAKRENGEIGICPSNYVELIN